MKDSDVLFEWKTHPFRDDPRRALLFAFTMAVTLFAVWWSFRSTGWVLIAAVLLGGALHRFWLPAHYRVSEDEIDSRQGFFRITRRLSAFRRVVLESKGAFLSPFAEPSRLEQYRGFFLPYPPDSEQLKSFLLDRFSEVDGRGE